MKSEYIDLTLPNNTSGWKQGWFYLDNPALALRERMGWVPVPGPEWTNQLASRDTEELKPLLDDLEQLKAEGLTGTVVAIMSRLTKKACLRRKKRASENTCSTCCVSLAVVCVLGTDVWALAVREERELWL
jgi:hypothetical protein